MVRLKIEFINWSQIRRAGATLKRHDAAKVTQKLGKRKAISGGITLTIRDCLIRRIVNRVPRVRAENRELHPPESCKNVRALIRCRI